MTGKETLRYIASLEVAAMDFERLSACNFPSPLAVEQLISAAELRGRAKDLHASLEAQLDAQAIRVRQIREATP